MNTGTSGGRPPATTARGPEQALAARLFAPAERWGWEYRAPSRRVRPARTAPVATLPLPHTAARVCRSYERFTPRDAALLGLVFSAGAVALATHGAAWDARMAAGQGGQDSFATLHLAAWAPYLALVAALLLARALLVAVAVRVTLRRWASAVAEAHRLHATALDAWAAAEAQAREAEEGRQRSEPQWFAIRPAVLRHLDVFGGTPESWRCLLVSAGCSLLGSGGEVVVVDLSQADIARDLVRAAEADGRPYDEVTLPEGSVITDMFDGLGPDRVADVLAETVHGSADRADHDRLGLDNRLLGSVCGALDAPLTVARICAGLRVLLHAEPAPGAPGAGLGEEEYDRIAALFTESYLQHAAARVTALESALHPLAALGRDTGARPTARHAPRARLQMVRITEDASSFSAQAAAHLVLQLLLSGMRGEQGEAGGPAGGRTLVVAAADELRGTQVEKLAQAARRRGVRLVLLFRHLRDDAEKMLGGGDTAYFMRLGNAAEATRAAEYIGREHRFVIHQSSLAVTDGTSESVNTGRSASLSHSAGSARHGGSSTTSSTSTTSTGTTTGESYALADSTGRQRVYEFAVEPSDLQALADHFFVFLDPSRSGPRARVGNCDPRLLERDTTADHPAEPVRP